MKTRYSKTTADGQITSRKGESLEGGFSCPSPCPFLSQAQAGMENTHSTDALGALQLMADESQTREPLLQLREMADAYSDAASPNNPNQTGLPDQLKAGIEAFSGYSMDDVRVHYNSTQPAQFQALAFAKGADIHLAPGQERHLPHEAWHVVQQKQGRVQATKQLKGSVGVNDEVGLEREADVMGIRAMANGRNQSKAPQGERMTRGALSPESRRRGKQYGKEQPNIVGVTKAPQSGTGERGKLKDVGKMVASIAPIQRVDLPPLGTQTTRSSAVGNPTVARPPARRGSGDTGWLDKSMMMRFCKLEHNVNGNYRPPGLSPEEKEKIGFRRAQADISRIKEWIEADYAETLWKISKIEKYIDEPEKIPFKEGSVTNLDQKKGNLIELRKIQMIWLNEIVKYGNSFDLGLKAVYSRTERDGALTEKALSAMEGGAASNLGHLAPIANSIFKLFTELFL